MGRLIAGEIWSSLESAAGSTGLVRQRVAPDAPIDIYVGVERPSGARVVLFGLLDADSAGELVVPQAMGIEVRAVPTASDKLWGYAEVRLSDARYAEVYESLADD